MHQGPQQSEGLTLGKADVGVVMETEDLRCIIDGQTMNVFQVTLGSESPWQTGHALIPTVFNYFDSQQLKCSSPVSCELLICSVLWPINFISLLAALYWNDSDVLVKWAFKAMNKYCTWLCPILVLQRIMSRSIDGTIIYSEWANLSFPARENICSFWSTPAHWGLNRIHNTDHDLLTVPEFI